MRRANSAPARPSVRRVLRAHETRLDALLTEWSATGRLTGSVAPRPDTEAKAAQVASNPVTSAAAAAADEKMRAVTDVMTTGLRQGVVTQPHRPSPRLKQGVTHAKQSAHSALEKAFERAASLHAKHMLAFKSAETLRKAAQAAVDLAAENGGKGKAKGQPSDAELQEELIACEQRSSEARAKFEQSKTAMDAARSKLQAARAESDGERE